MASSQSSMDETLVIGARPKTAATSEQNRQRMDRSRSNSRGRSVLTKRIGRGAEIDMTSPIRTRSGSRSESVGFVDTPIGLGPQLHCYLPGPYPDPHLSLLVVSQIQP